MPRPTPLPRLAVLFVIVALLGPSTATCQGPPAEPTLSGSSLPPGARRFYLLPRSALDFHAEFDTTPGGETVGILSGGVRLMIEGVRVDRLGEMGLDPQIGTVGIWTDRAVIWTRGLAAGAGGGSIQSQDAPLEIYLEGNIEFRQGDRVIYADRMFYDAQRNVGVILNAELLTPIPRYKGKQYDGFVRLRAAAIRQLNESEFLAQDALVTTSRLEEPSYHFGSESILFRQHREPRINPATGLYELDPATGLPATDNRYLATSSNNRLYVAGVPVFYWPRIATDLSRPTYFINNIRLRSDSVFGVQALFDFDAYQLFGIENAPRNTEWEISLDPLSKRGIGVGTSLQYQGLPIGRLPGGATGEIDLWGIRDVGRDNLGLGRRNIVPEAAHRGRAFARHRHEFGNGWQLDAEAGWLSDRTFLDEYYEREWDEDKNQTTGLSIKRTTDNRSASLRGTAQVNNFFTETQWLPRFDHYWLGQPILGGTLTWYEHTTVGYANLGPASMPTNPVLAAQWKRLPWEANVAGERIVSRQEIDLPVSLGPVRIVPYALGELGHWGSDLNGNSIDRGFFQSGIRGSLPMWAVYPQVADPLFNLTGLAHKVVFDAEYSYADANQNFDRFPLYDNLDDDAIEEYRRRLFFTTFGGVLPGQVPARFDARTYAIRSGLQGSVTAPLEVVEDQQAVRIGMRHRWQTKRGRPGAQHIVDWLTFDANLVWFPDAGRDNFGADFGLANYDLKWHLGDRFTVLSDAQADFFGDGLRTGSAGILINRPLRGNGYVGVRSFRGPINADILTGSYAYRISPKWVSTAAASIDISSMGNIGQSLSVTRIGESLLVTLGINVDASKNNVGANFLIEPRFLPKTRLTRDTGLTIPPVGAYGIE